MFYSCFASSNKSTNLFCFLDYFLKKQNNKYWGVWATPKGS